MRNNCQTNCMISRKNSQFKPSFICYQWQPNLLFQLVHSNRDKLSFKNMTDGITTFKMWIGVQECLHCYEKWEYSTGHLHTVHTSLHWWHRPIQKHKQDESVTGNTTATWTSVAAQEILYKNVYNIETPVRIFFLVFLKSELTLDPMENDVFISAATKADTALLKSLVGPMFSFH